MKLLECPRCLKIQALCVCEGIQAQSSMLRVLILQHPQEMDKALGTARLAHLALSSSKIQVGLSWPNLQAALQEPTHTSEWAVLYLGNNKTSPGERLLQWIPKSGKQAPPQVSGIVLLDGTWSQAKTLWWRNPWLLKLHRMVLNPPHPSLYQNLRKQPRKHCLSTIESIAYSLTALGECAEVPTYLLKIFQKLLDAAKTSASHPTNP
jgi:hypothetical protein